MFSRIQSRIKERVSIDPVFNNGLHWTTIVSEKLLLAIIGALTMAAAAVELRSLWYAQSVGLTDLFLFFIYAEIVGMVGAFYASRRIPVTLPIIIAITREQTNNTIFQSIFLLFIIFYSPFNISKLFIKFIP